MIIFNNNSVFHYLLGSHSWAELAKDWTLRILKQLAEAGYHVDSDDLELHMESERYMCLRQRIYIEDPLTGKVISGEVCLGALVMGYPALLSLGGIVKLYRSDNCTGLVFSAWQFAKLDKPWKLGFLRKFMDEATASVRPLLLPATQQLPAELLMMAAITEEMTP